MTTATAQGGRTTTYVWVILSAITVVSWFLAPAHAHGVAEANVTITIAVLLMAAIKARLIIQYFMEVRTAPMWLRISTDVWLVALFGGVLGIYLY
jgi:hypothetical protein